MKKFTLEDGIATLRALEARIFEDLGMHLALGGSLAYRGHSSKDIDIIVYPHAKDTATTRERVAEWLADCGFTQVYDRPDATACPDVLVTEHDDGRRVDWFFMSRERHEPAEGEL